MDQIIKNLKVRDAYNFKKRSFFKKTILEDNLEEIAEKVINTYSNVKNIKSSMMGLF